MALSSEDVIDMSKLNECGEVYATPLIADGRVYFGALDKYFYCFDFETGQKIWDVKMNGLIASGAKVHNGVVYFGCFDSYIYAYDAKTGDMIWKFKTNGFIASASEIRDDVIYFGSADTFLYAVSVKTQELLWKFKTGGRVIGDPIVFDNKIYFGSKDKHFYCIGIDGSLLWKFRTGGAIVTGKAVCDKTKIYFASGDGIIYALTLDGVFVWGFRTGESCYNNPLLHKGMLYCGSRDRYLYALDAKTGEMAWSFNCGIMMVHKPVVFDDKICFGSSLIYCLDLNTHEVAWKINLSESESNVIASVAFLDNRIIFCTRDNLIRCVDKTNGTLFWQARTNSSERMNLAGVFSPVVWDTQLHENLDENAKARMIKKQEEFEKFEPYTFTEIYRPLGVLEKNSGQKEKYGFGENPSAGVYRDIGATEIYARIARNGYRR